MRKLVVAVAALAFLAPSSAHALAFVGARVGYGMPSGEAEKGQKIKDSVSSVIPIQIDAGLSMLNILSLGVYAGYGPVQLKSDYKQFCKSCSVQDLRAGVQVNLRPPLVLKSLWGGAFGGYQRVSTSGTNALDGSKIDVKMSGWEAGLQGGWDFSLLPLISVGPYVSYSMGKYTSASGADLGTQGQHQMLTIGLRGLFDL
jgi:hypothetical protein